MNKHRMMPVIRNWMKHRLNNISAVCEAAFNSQMTGTEMYENLIGNETLLRDIRKITALLPRQNMNKRQVVTVGGHRLQVYIQLRSTNEDRQYLIPEDIWIDPESKLGRALLEQCDIHLKWERTKYLFNHFATDTPLEVVCFLLPWLNELAVELKAEIDAEAPAFGPKASAKFLWRHIFRNTGDTLNDVSANSAQKGLDMMLRAHHSPNDFPALTRRVSQWCDEGSTLIAQHSMLQSSGFDPRGQYDNIVRLTDDCLPPEIKQEINDNIAEWRGNPGK